ncbi:hypothetical protein RD792_001157 [Penstemon davidsonii]|uniref:t-SNARE coiled-coil homology domain-containing protein n=1 Tax=Penstemon davidsonii TaxID=160366 RepID=A0ABR0DNC4_9LAMI|nr:hypothetical protein RD792_001157 [Penstemon davidsonii]
MFGFRKSPSPANKSPESDNKNTITTPGRRTSSEPTLVIPDDDDDDYFGRGSSSGVSSYRNNKQKKNKDDLDTKENKEHNLTSKDDNDRGKKSRVPEQRQKLGLAPNPEPTNALQRVEMEKAKQDDGLSDLSDILGDLKGMAIDMGSELNRQNQALDHLQDDVDELNSRVKGANQRARHLVGK